MKALHVTEKVVEAHFQMFKAPVGYLQLMFSCRSCFDKMQNPVSLWDKFGFSAGEKVGEKLPVHMPYGSYSQSLWALLERRGNGLPQNALTFTKPLNLHFIPIHFKLCEGKKKSFSCGATPFILVSVWWADQISFLLPLWCAAGFRLFRLPYLNSSTHMCTLLQSCC